METTERELAEERDDASEWLLADEAGGSGEPELRSGESELAELAQPEVDDLAWYCVQTRPKSEHIARASLLQFGDVEVYCPRLRYHKTTRRGKVWFTEALFPGYLFARFDLGSRLRAVSHANAVSKLLNFGDRYATLRPEIIEQIKLEMVGEELLTIESHDPIEVGEETEIATGPLRGLRGIVTRLLSGGERVRILMEMFGDLKEVEMRADALIATRGPKDTLAAPQRSILS